MYGLDSLHEVTLDQRTASSDSIPGGGEICVPTIDHQPNAKNAQEGT